MVKLDIISDPVCPWCYIGKTNLFKALEAVPDHPFVMEWHPFQLDPTIPATGMDRATYMENKFGSKEAVVKMHVPLMQQADAAGAEINLEKITRSPNTLDAHRLIHWARIEQRQTFVVDLLFRAYWVDGRDIGDHEVLADIADTAEMDAGMVTKLLASDADIADIKAREAHSRKMGINAVPTFIVANQHAVSGAQQPDVWARVIKEIMDKIEEEK